MRLVCVHGIGKQQAGEEMLLAEWLPALRDGMTRAGGVGVLADDDVGMAFYGYLFRPAGTQLGAGDPLYRAADVKDGLETDLLLSWWAEAARVDTAVVPPDADTLLRTPGSVQAGLRALSRSRYFAKVALRSMIFDLKQVSGYLAEPALRTAARARVMDAITLDTRVVVAHSLGSVIAYEALHQLHQSGKGSAGHNVRALITLGSPLGIRNLIFERLQPAPVAGVGAWPGPGTLAWTNVVDAGDVVALVKDLRPQFGDRVRSWQVHNGSHAHDVRSYLTDGHTGMAIARGLA